ncbi:MAG: tetratricopeptide repeat protein [Acidobacteriota bacterium]
MTLFTRFVLALMLLMSCSGNSLIGAENTASEKFDLLGEVHLGDKGRLRKLRALVTLSGQNSAYMDQSWTFLGKFKFRDVPAGNYELRVEIPRRGEQVSTVVLSRSFADRKNRVRQLVRIEEGIDPDSARKFELVSVKSLSIPPAAIKEYLDGRKSLSRPDYPKALRHFEAAVKIAPNFAAAINHIGVIHYQSREYDKALLSFETALEKEPAFHEALVNLGGVLLSLGQLDRALEINLRAVAVRPEDPLSNAQLGLSYLAADDLAKAELHLSKTRQIDPAHFTHPQLALAEIRLRQNRMLSAIEDLKEFLKYHPDHEQAPKVREQIQRLEHLNSLAQPSDKIASTQNIPCSKE